MANYNIYQSFYFKYIVRDNSGGVISALLTEIVYLRGMNDVSWRDDSGAGGLNGQSLGLNRCLIDVSRIS